MGKYIKIVDDLHDRRGNILITSHGGVDYLLIHTNKGYLRGGEIHRGTQYNLLISGKIRWTTPENEIIYTTPTLFTTPGDTPHMMESLTDSLILEWREYPIENPPNYYDPYRSLIKRSMEEP